MSQAIENAIIAKRAELKVLNDALDASQSKAWLDAGAPGANVDISTGETGPREAADYLRRALKEFRVQVVTRAAEIAQADIDAAGV